VILGGAAAIIIGVVVAGQSQPAHVTVNVQGM
jgi:hypothetical protein